MKAQLGIFQTDQGLLSSSVSVLSRLSETTAGSFIYTGDGVIVMLLGFIASSVFIDLQRVPLSFSASFSLFLAATYCVMFTTSWSRKNVKNRHVRLQSKNKGVL